MINIPSTSSKKNKKKKGSRLYLFRVINILILINLYLIKLLHNQISDQPEQEINEVKIATSSQCNKFLYHCKVVIEKTKPKYQVVFEQVKLIGVVSSTNLLLCLKRVRNI